ncbi:MAG: asparagine synthase [Gomphosphaeria aponina SAG 52.96 = DSM 107014]|uniref:asparagine synthase (glutamine-hydrolyzing) n=1 Tax=Gomphosphaeria aponina SAG 52.96 = DSM 107014 TaxID=1521640 RepID=A0A941GYB5_9CHRO|nr:asparagine synthase [Gomphosphaeria aponina SAG 52.96 = DSM 107014]
MNQWKYLLNFNSNQQAGCVTWKVGEKPVFSQAFSPQKKFWVVGDMWLTNRSELYPGWEGRDEDLVALLWEKWGVACLQQLEGIFGLVVWEEESQSLWLVRDRTGGKTLYYTNTGSTFAISPCLQSLAPYHSQELDLVALRDYLCCSFIPGERTLWKNVRELRPGSFLCLPKGKITSYWQPEEEITNGEKPLEWHGEKLRSLLNQIIQEYLPENESVGVYLSGGLDSSCITALAAKFHAHPVHTYSIHFGAECPHELEFSSLVASHCQTEHHILEITPQQMWEQLPITLANLDDPIGDPLTVPNYLLAQFAREKVKVILNGEGGDPCFGGPKNQPMLLSQLYNQEELLLAYLTSYQKCATDLSRLLKPDVWKAVENEVSVFAADLYADANYLNRLMLLNIKFKGADQILTKVNNLTKAAGLAGRSPLFDQRIVKLAMETPPQYKLAGAEEKAILKQAVADILPREIIKRPKSGMMVPVQLWFRKYWQRQARDLLLSKKAAIAPYLNQDLIRDWLHYRGDLWGRYGVKLWLLVSLEIWLRVRNNC